MLHKLVLVLTLSSLASVAAFAESFDLGSHGKLDFDLPKDWAAESQKVGDEAFNIDVRPNSQLNAACKITVMFLPETPDLTDEVFRERFVQNLGPFEAGSVEKEAQVQKLNLKSGMGIYACFTDASLVGKPSKPRDYKVIAPGMIKLDGGVIAAVSLFSDDKAGKDFADMVKMLESITLAAAK